MYYHLILTDACNLCCSYCRAKDFEESDPFGEGVTFDEDVPPELSFDLNHLYRFLAEDPEAVLTFYGGEPLMRLDLVREVMDHAPVGRFMLQTNAMLLDRLEPEYRNRFSTILVSIDGPEPLTDAHRGRGVYRRVTENVRVLLDGGYTGELIARMTVTEETDIEEAVLHLAENSDHSFSSVHWQIDANFWGDYSKRDFGRWAASSYNPGIRRLAARWVARMREDGTVPKWYPFLGVTADLLLGRESGLRCGCGYANYAVMTDGTIIPCPCMVGMKEWYLGHVAETRPQDLRRVPVGGACTTCDLAGFCGGRCLYSNVLNPWPAEGRRLVCGTVRNLRDAVVSVLPEVRALIRGGVVTLDDFAFERYNGCEIIP
ncbi:TIGR04084 family radical SAM/SPASM domain-containing protein [Methanofollis formosanus]|uniref:TIGR04084 family radical SAM/SPASM domain-containing protein n=1 Tax=Methanofollis formosanus TaxID=299308 RepID=A0A8G1A1X2_9EURY|nr:TIGR04084 family radical SAM/SPASM domain-containing protein [Methanofollis formosanus]QYZ78879.1 TIGR04084 family radical SAM/SPASM domain-containing protein [Methanofollis formosanus]